MRKVLDTKTKNYVEKMKPSPLAFKTIVNGQIYSKSRSYNIITKKTKSFKLKDKIIANIKLQNVIKDERRNDIFLYYKHNDNKNKKRISLISSINEKENVNEYTIAHFIDLTAPIMRNLIIYDHYLLYLKQDKPNSLFITDFDASQSKDRVEIEWNIKCRPLRSHLLLVHHSVTNTQIVLQKFIQNCNVSFELNKDVIAVIGLFFGNHYDHKVYIFPKHRKTFNYKRFRTWISFGLIINDFIQQIN